MSHRYIYVKGRRDPLKERITPTYLRNHEELMGKVDDEVQDGSDSKDTRQDTAQVPEEAEAPVVQDLYLLG